MNNLNKNEIENALNLNDGYILSELHENDLTLIRSIVENHWKRKIIEHYKEKKEFILNKNIYDYHKFADSLDHKKMWPMKNRVLEESDFITFLNTRFYSKLKNIYQDIEITDEYNFGHGEVYWRIVRPNEKLDVGPIHADRWFWEINKDYTPKKKKRIKCWISLWCDGNNGLRIIPSSQKTRYEYQYEFRDGENKPVFNPENYDLKPINIDSSSGKIVIFHDSLLHGGAVNNSTSTRISIEFTFFTSK